MEVSDGQISIGPITGNLPGILWIASTNKIALFHENHSIYEGHPPQGLFEARRVKEVYFGFLVIDPPRGRPFGGGGVYRSSREVSIPHFI